MLRIVVTTWKQANMRISPTIYVLFFEGGEGCSERQLCHVAQGAPLPRDQTLPSSQVLEQLDVLVNICSDFQS